MAEGDGFHPGSERNVHLTLSYDGTDFHGWQFQPGCRTVEGVLEAALSALEGGQVDVHGASRTDQGVHALGQSASFVSRSRIPLEKYAEVVNGRLPRDLRAIAARGAPPEFHARFSAAGKRYRYSLDRSVVPCVFRARYSLHYPDSLALEDIRAAALSLVGEHDFASFQCESGESPPSSVRHVDAILIGEEGALLHFDVWGRSFLYKMVRTLVGTLLEVGRGRWKPAQVRGVLEARDRRAAGPTAPPHGLTLRQVYYDLPTLAGSIEAVRAGGSQG